LVGRGRRDLNLRSFGFFPESQPNFDGDESTLHYTIIHRGYKMEILGKPTRFCLLLSSPCLLSGVVIPPLWLVYLLVVHALLYHLITIEIKEN